MILLAIHFILSLLLFTCTGGYTQTVLAYVHGFILCMSVYVYLNTYHGEKSSKNNEMYGLQHTLFNIEIPPRTYWFNMGLWDKENLTYPQACENLVVTVAEIIGIQPNSTILGNEALIYPLCTSTYLSQLDVGFGCGDSCIVLAEQYKGKVTGITNELSQYELATDRVRARLLEDQVYLIHGVAEDLNECDAHFNYILSIDSAYHYLSRWTFLADCHNKLLPGGSIGLYDLTLDPLFVTKMKHPLFTLLLKGLTHALHIPPVNLVTAVEYEKYMVDIGYTNIHIDVLDKSMVFGGLSRIYRTQSELLLKYGIGSLSSRLALKLCSYGFGWLESYPFFLPVIVKGDKPSN
ncbi:S-adenosyl-L-methionine-dependent methyltransferase [Pilobolus umbonatus]|nr:S-adenosyl-L-methionine-dependent methyltransferase [Pilobolus umbonatus]